MENKLTLGLTISIISILLISSFTVLATSLPFERYGQANIDGGTVEDGYTVTSWIDGTQYGDNETYHGDGSYRIITDGDDETDTTVKSGGESGDTIVYRIEDQDGNVYIADETDTFDSGGDTAADLNYASGSQPSTDVKINELVPQPDDAGNQYVYIYDPVNITLGDWELSDHDGFSATLDTLTTHYFEADNLLYVELDGTEPIGTDAGHLMLSWNPDTSGIADNNMVVMDRVEFGNQDTQPQNTTLIDYLGAPAQGQGLVRETDGVDTDDCDADFTVAAETGRHVTLTTASTEGGSVTTPGEGTYDHYQYNDVNIEATPDANYNFVEWTGDNGTIADTKTSSTTITMEGDYSITANFE
ncbi:MAG: InlB B-repeat-containing protein, partial [Candidatus Saliniplasma sp.]